MTPLMWLGGGAVLALLIFGLDRMAVKVVQASPRAASREPDGPGVDAEAVNIAGDGVSLCAWMLTAAPGRDVPDAATGPVAVLTHGWGRSHEVMRDLGHTLARAGHPVLLIDVRGHGSNPAAPYVTARHFRDDVRAAADFARGRFPGRPLALVGHSMGGAASVLAAEKYGDIDAVVLIASPADVLEVTARYLSERGLPGSLMVGVLQPFWWIRVGGTFRHLSPERKIRALGIPLLLLHAEHDERVPRGHTDRLSQASGCSVTVIAGAGHSDVLQRPELTDHILRFLERLRG